MPADVLAVLELPSLEDVTTGQSRGADCAWCGTGPLNTETSVDLGQQKSVTGIAWFPRACRPCAADRAHRGIFQHAPMCEQCADEASRCEIGVVLYRLIRQRV